MIQRIALAGAGLAAAVALTACTAPESPAEESSPPPSEAVADSTEDAPTPGVMTTQGAMLPDFPAAIEPLPDSEIISSSLGEVTAGEDAGSASAEPPAEGEGAPAEEETPAEEAGAGQVNAALVMRTASSEDDILAFYTESLEGHGFRAVGEAGTQDGVTTQAFHAEGDGQTVSVSIGPDPDDEAQRLVTVGGVVNG
ncbi:hypothetical protein [Brevibacterium ihuae]|uniref:hypothetical protein n=1 Tax=Brevibacterium ihuae TaxID=1631743 RepID=UPI000C758674|nr:hypothetical protein [Brevibacterium ihuae]